MPQSTPTRRQGRLAASARQTLSMVTALLPILVAVVLLTGLLLELLPTEAIADWFGRSQVLDALIGALAGSIAVGHPVTGYVLGGELLDHGVGLVAVTALLVSWVTVGSIQLPAEMALLGRRFALYRNLICFALSILIALLTATTMDLAGLGR